VKANEAQLRASLDRPGSARLILLHGPDEAGAFAWAERVGKALGADVERIDLDGATLKGDPARLADEAAALSLFGGARWVRATIGEESLAAVEALLAAERTGNPVVAIAPNVRGTGALVKLALASPQVVSFACYAPTGQQAERIAADLLREAGVQPGGQVARRIAAAAAGDRAVMAREIEKLALYLDAAPERPRPADDAALDAIGADLGEAEAGRAIAAIVGGRPPELALELARLDEAGVSPIAWLRQLARRIASLAEMRAEVDAGQDVDSVMKRHRVFFKEEAATRQALGRWPSARLMAALDAVRRAERATMAPGNAGEVLANHAAIGLSRQRQA
jgi:DNA polymerase-3 subunit delta